MKETLSKIRQECISIAKANVQAIGLPLSVIFAMWITTIVCSSTGNLGVFGPVVVVTSFVLPLMLGILITNALDKVFCEKRSRW